MSEPPDWTESLLAVATAVLAIATIALVVAACWSALLVRRQLTAAASDARESRARAQLQASVTFYASTLETSRLWSAQLPDDRDRTAIRRLLRRLDGSRGRAHARRRAVIASYLDYWELVATAINRKAFDEGLVADLVSERLIAVWDSYLPYIQSERSKYSPALYEQLDRVVQEWTAAARRG